MYGPDSYLYETNLALLATLPDEELADPTLIAQLTPGTAALATLGQWLAEAAERGLTALGEAFAPLVVPSDPASAYWLHPPL